jgi:benzodiazapine receptor
MENIRLRELPKLVLCILICQAAGVAGSIFTSSSVYTWYPTLVKPSFTPPGWVIGSVWIVFFTLMGISLFLVWRDGLEHYYSKSAIFIFAAQLAVNILWSWAFFQLQSPIAGVVVIGVLWIMILLTMVKFWQISREAALLLAPYLLWVSFAAFLNYNIWKLNS